MFDTVLIETSSAPVAGMAGQGSRYNEVVQAAGKGRPYGPPHIWTFGGLLQALLSLSDAKCAENQAPARAVYERYGQMDN